MLRVFTMLGAINAFVAVGAGAFGAHALRARLTPEALEVWRTGAHYHLIHAVALLAIAALAGQLGAPNLARLSGWLLFAGIVLFSGSLYALALTGIRPLGAVTPFGGLCFLVGWVLLAVAARK